LTNVLAPMKADRESRISVGDHTLFLERTDSGAVIRLVSPDGSRPIEIEITPSGPILRLRSGMAIAVDGAVSLGAETVDICARRELSLRSEGKIIVHAGGEMASEADAHTIVARSRDVRVSANDDVIMNGERIRLNG